MYGIYANIGGILMVNVTIYSSTMDPVGTICPSHNVMSCLFWDDDWSLRS